MSLKNYFFILGKINNIMCMISKEIRAVAATKLFCGVNSDRSRQFTVYANTVDNSSRNNAMVLPVPFPQTVKFHNLENYANFFSDCDKCFAKTQTWGEKSLSSNSFSATRSMPKLQVHNVGSYKVSIANSLNDLYRVDESVFDLSQGLQQMLEKYYSNPVFGFIICKLKEGNESYHPFAYSHQITNKRVFIPTRHYHAENNTNINDFYNNFNTSFGMNISDIADDWDHDIYLYNIDLKSNKTVFDMNECDDMWIRKININLNKLNFPLDTTCKMFNKMEINGKHKNMDIVLEAY